MYVQRRMKMDELNDKYFAVTDHHVIIPLRVIDIEEVDIEGHGSLFKITTK